ncbi:MAG: GC-type dockerin domain-anchored protein [Planctomycetota bacterium]
MLSVIALVDHAIRPTVSEASWDTHTRCGSAVRWLGEAVRTVAATVACAAALGLAAGPVLAGGDDGGSDGGDGGPGVEPVPFEGCGVIDITPGPDGESDCFTFVTHNGRFLIANIGEFDDGDAVCTIGELLPTPCGDDGCGELTGCIINNVVFEAFQGYGSVLVDGGDCGMFETASGERYQVAGGMPVGLAPGDGINVVGALNPDCVSFCDVPCVEMPSITPGHSRTGTFRLSPGGCPQVMTDDGEVLNLQRGEDHLPGDRVYVSGRREESSGLCPDSTLPGLEDNMISSLVEVCGEILAGPAGCWYLQTTSLETYLIDDIAGAALHDVIFVAGVPDSANSVCPETSSITIQVVGVDRCLPGDATLDGRVDVDDLIAIIAAWGTGDDWADLNNDGVVNVDDLLASLLNWG